MLNLKSMFEGKVYSRIFGWRGASQRKPLTEEEIKMALLIRGFPYDAFMAGVRWAEKHHFGIGVNKSDPDSIDLQSRCRGDKL